MSKFTRNLNAIKKLNVKINNLIDVLEIINKDIGKSSGEKKLLSDLFTRKNKVFNMLCKLQDILTLEIKLNKILLNRSVLNDKYLDFFNDFLTVDYFKEYYNLSEKECDYILIQGKKINHSQSNTVYF